MIPNTPGQFEIHVFDHTGKEAGIYTENGWINKHGHKGRPANCPSRVEMQLKGQAVDILRRSGKLPDKGKGNIKGNAWMNRGGTAAGIGGIFTGVIHMFTLEACRTGTTAQCFCALEAEQLGADPGECMSCPTCSR